MGSLGSDAATLGAATTSGVVTTDTAAARARA